MPPNAEIPPASYIKVCEQSPKMTSVPLGQCTSIAIKFPIVPLGTNNAFSLPNLFAAISSRVLIDGSSPKTSSPIWAFDIASLISGEGCVTVSLRKSIIEFPKSS